MKKILALLLALCMLFAMVACSSEDGQSSNTGSGSQTSDTGSDVKDQMQGQQVQQQQEGPNQEETYIKDEMVLAWNATTSVTPWGTKNSSPGNYEVYEMLYECDTKGEMYPLLADATYEGNYMPGMDHEPGSGVYKVKIYDYITDHKGRAVTASDVAFSFMHQFQNESTSGWGDMVSVEAEDDTTVVFTFTEDQTDVGQLLAAGINAEAKILDNSSANTLRADTTGWDLELGMMAGDFNVTVWQHGFSYGNTSTGDRTMYHLVDDEWEALLNVC